MQNQKEIRIHAAIKDKWLLPFSQCHRPEKSSFSLVGDQWQYILDFNQKIQNGTIPFETLPCLCGSIDFSLLASYDRYAMRQSTVLCMGCGLIQSNPRMTKEAYADFYSSDVYRCCYDSSDYLRIYEEKFSLDTGREIFVEISKIKEISKGISVLEIGAGGGWNLVPFLKAGAQVIGYDYSPTLVDFGIKHGVAMVQGSVDDIQGKFDVIILNHVWEHLSDPVASLRKITQHLNNDGLIYIGIPNIYNGMLSQFQVAHTYFFDPKTFHHYASRAGLKLLTHGAAEGAHMFGTFKPGDDVNAPGLKNHYKDVLRILRRVRFKRNIKIFLQSLRLIG